MRLNTMRSPGAQGRGRCHTDSTEAMMAASRAMKNVARCGSVVAETETGASSSSEKGLCNPPVRASSPPSCSRSNATCPAARSELGRCELPSRSTSHRLTPAESPISRKHETSGSGKPSPKATNSTPMACPPTASQRSSTRVCSRSGRQVEGKGRPSAWVMVMSGPFRGIFGSPHSEAKTSFKAQKVTGTALILPQRGPPKDHRDWENENDHSNHQTSMVPADHRPHGFGLYPVLAARPCRPRLHHVGRKVRRLARKGPGLFQQGQSLVQLQQGPAPPLEQQPEPWHELERQCSL